MNGAPTRRESGALDPSDLNLFWHYAGPVDRDNNADLDHRIRAVDVQRRHMDRLHLDATGEGGQTPQVLAGVLGTDGWDDPDEVTLDGE